MLFRFLSILAFTGLLYSCSNSSTIDKSRKEDVWTLASFQKADSVNPVLIADSTLLFTDPILNKKVQWAAKDVFNPAAVVRHDTVFLLFRAEDEIGKYAGTSRIGLAWSVDGLHFQKYSAPVLFPANDAYKKVEWEGGCEDPRVVEDVHGIYYMTYTAYDGDKARLMVASSPDLFHWTKHGLAFANPDNDKYAKGWSKSGAIVSAYQDDGRIVATKINGKYWMYWGDQNIWAATSDDLIHWTPVQRKAADDTVQNNRGIAKDFSELKTVIAPRKKKFDSDLVESGPPAMITDRGILLMYNSRNIPSIGDTALAEGTYAAAQVLLDKNDPTKVIERMDHYFIKPEKPYEVSGQVNRVCFIEGLVRYKEKWFLYYGTADSKIAVAVMK
ncbi:MAG: glycoside hydrolase family 130 protein [Flavisolibacter sp.]